MTITGQDIVIRLRPHARHSVKDAILRLARRHWPECVAEDVSTDRMFRLTDPKDFREFAPGNEFFAYRNEAEFNDWASRGRTDDNATSMLHFIIEEQRLTVVHEGMDKFISDLADALS